MAFLRTLEIMHLLDSALSLVVAFVLGTLIGMERQYRQRSAGLRTNTLVALGAAGFVDLGQRLAGDAEAVRVIAYVVSGIGFLGAGVIMKDGMNVRGLNTAATLWCSAAVGSCAGSDMVVEAIMMTVFVLAANTLLHPLVDRINRTPLRAERADARFELRITTDNASLSAVRRLLIERLNGANYPVADIDVAERGEELLEVTAVLVSTAVIPKELDAVTAALLKDKRVRSASWESSTLE